tara:strand:+ start:2688 stop:3023 length:336 start_codon:yes stop_codon:yes gene_type:complete
VFVGAPPEGICAGVAGARNSVCVVSGPPFEVGKYALFVADVLIDAPALSVVSKYTCTLPKLYSIALAVPADAISIVAAALLSSAERKLPLFMERSSSILDGFTNFAAGSGG